MFNIFKESLLLHEAIYSLKSNQFDYNFKELEKAISKAKRILLITHISPDADALGSTGVLYSAIKKKHTSKDVKILDEKQKDILPEKDDLVIFLDLSTYKRVSKYEEVNVAFNQATKNYTTARIDHHDAEKEPKNERIVSDITIADTKAGSTCELVTLFLNDANYEITPKMAELLFKGIVADNGRFQYSINKTGLLAVSILGDIGVNYEEVYNKMYLKSPEYIRGKKFVLNNKKKTKNGVAYILVDSNIANANGFDRGETASMVHELSDDASTPIWIIGNNLGNKINVRVRSRGLDISSIAKKFGGGGHPNASGVSLNNKNDFAKLVLALDKYAEANKSLLKEAAEAEEYNKEKYIEDYNKYLKEHISNVQKAYNWLRKHMWYMFEDEGLSKTNRLDENIKNHDASKYSKEEFLPYAKYFNIDKEKYQEEFDRAWNHHQKCNPHHWQYWLLLEDGGKTIPLEMDLIYVAEMFADWMSFSVKVGKLEELIKWYEKESPKMTLHKNTKKFVDELVKEYEKVIKERPLTEGVMSELDIEGVTQEVLEEAKKVEHIIIEDPIEKEKTVVKKILKLMDKFDSNALEMTINFQKTKYKLTDDEFKDYKEKASKIHWLKNDGEYSWNKHVADIKKHLNLEIDVEIPDYLNEEVNSDSRLTPEEVNKIAVDNYNFIMNYAKENNLLDDKGDLKEVDIVTESKSDINFIIYYGTDVHAEDIESSEYVVKSSDYSKKWTDDRYTALLFGNMEAMREIQYKLGEAGIELDYVNYVTLNGNPIERAIEIIQSVKMDFTLYSYMYYVDKHEADEEFTKEYIDYLSKNDILNMFDFYEKEELSNHDYPINKMVNYKNKYRNMAKASETFRKNNDIMRGLDYLKRLSNDPDKIGHYKNINVNDNNVLEIRDMIKHDVYTNKRCVIVLYGNIGEVFALNRLLELLNAYNFGSLREKYIFGYHDDRLVYDNKFVYKLDEELLPDIFKKVD